jgi:hypothetical protein
LSRVVYTSLTLTLTWRVTSWTRPRMAAAWRPAATRRTTGPRCVVKGSLYEPNPNPNLASDIVDAPADGSGVEAGGYKAYDGAKVCCQG